VLIVEDFQALRQTFARQVGVSFDPVAVATAAAAGQTIDALDAPPAGAIIDVHLPDGSGLDVLQRLRARFPGTPVMVVTGSRDPAIPNRSHLLDAMFVAKPVPVENVDHFLAWIETAGSGGDPVAAAIAQLARQYQLPPRETQILAVSLSGVERKQLAVKLGISENTLKSRIRALIGRTGDSSLDGVERRVLAMVGKSGAINGER
jgi:DNA-binding NarL/FixJ family response regulator